MSEILFYSNYCKFCSELIQFISKYENLKKDIHFICLDNRKKIGDNNYIILPNQKEILMPKQVVRVPALLLSNYADKILFGSSINKHIEDKVKNIKNKNDELETFNLFEINNSGVYSDNFSFLNQDADEMSAKGSGGLRQLRNNVTLEYLDNIETPIDSYEPNKEKEFNMNKLREEREKALH